MFQNGNKNKFLLDLLFLLSLNKLKIETNKAHIHETCFHSTPNTLPKRISPRPETDFLTYFAVTDQITEAKESKATRDIKAN